MKENSGPKNIPAGRGVDPQLLEAAKKTVFEPEAQETFACRICDTPGASEQSEGLCWVCRRLKISAWKESEQQMMFTE